MLYSTASESAYGVSRFAAAVSVCNVIPVFESSSLGLKKDVLPQNSKWRDVTCKIYNPKMKTLTFCVDCTVEMLRL